MLSREVEGLNLFPFSISFVTQKGSSNGQNASVRFATPNIVKNDNLLVLNSTECKCSLRLLIVTVSVEQYNH